MEFRNCILAILILHVAGLAANAQLRITIDHNTDAAVNAGFRFKRVPSPAKDDAAAHARVLIVDGEADPNSGDVNVLTDGQLPDSDDQPRRNFFIIAGSGGARVLIDLGRLTAIAQVNTFSWHPNARAPQVYRLWGSDGRDSKFNAEPKADINPAACGWQSIAIVDTRSTDEDKDGGQFGVSITDASGNLGSFRYLLFDCYVTEVADNFGNTFYSEFDVIAKKAN